MRAISSRGGPPRLRRTRGLRGGGRGSLVTSLVILGVATLLLGTAFAFAWRSLDRLPDRASLTQASASVSRSDPSQTPLTRVSSEPNSGVRYVERDGIVGPRLPETLERIEPIEPFGPPAPALPEEPARELHRLVVIESAGVINARSHRIRLAHVAAPDASRMCRRANGSAWPCGKRARTALRRLVRRRAIGCLAIEEPAAEIIADDPVPALCEVAGTDLSRWLVEYGWALPDKGAPKAWERLHASARLNERGLFASNPR